MIVISLITFLGTFENDEKRLREDTKTSLGEGRESVPAQATHEMQEMRGMHETRLPGMRILSGYGEIRRQWSR